MLRSSYRRSLPASRSWEEGAGDTKREGPSLSRNSEAGGIHDLGEGARSRVNSHGSWVAGVGE
jgi:hypothetical protein